MKSAIAALLVGVAGTATAEPRLDPVYSSNAVIQRDRPIHVTGSGNPGEEVAVSFAGQSRTVRADVNGRWTAVLPPMQAGGPHRLTATGAGGAAAVADNVLIGDVWLCSGQSNMEWPISRSLNGESEAQAATDDQVRLMSIAHKTASAPEVAFQEAPGWQVLSPETAGDFSAACYFMARDLRKSTQVPFGLIDSSWGGTRIRPWMDEPAAHASGNAEDAQLLALYRTDPAAAGKQFGEQWGAWWRERSGDAVGAEPWNASDRLQWTPVPSIQPWEQWGVDELADFNGHVWVRRKFTLTPAQAATGATLSLGVIDDLDQTWVNGVGVGSEYGWDNGREYRVTPGLLRAGENEVVVNIADGWDFGGFHGPAERLKLTLADGTVIPLGDGWEYSVAPREISGSPRAPWDSHAGLGTIYNAMIAPLGPVGLRGVAWYQGEADVGLPDYDSRLSALMSSWRRQFRDPQLPFLIIGLAGFGQRSATPTDSGWARLQDEQRQAAERDPRAVLVPALDIGERLDVHPPNKQEVGRRLALAARSLVYEDAEGRLAPTPVAARRTEQGIQVDFTSALHAFSGARPLAFELCGETQDSCRYVEGRIAGNSVLLTSDGRPASRVRYAWSDFPVVNLYSGDLPVPTFELPIR